jgi:hypothetical protein
MFHRYPEVLLAKITSLQQSKIGQYWVKSRLRGDIANGEAANWKLGQQHRFRRSQRDLQLLEQQAPKQRKTLPEKNSRSLTSALESTPLPIASRPRPARGMPAVIPPFFGLFGLISVQISTILH